MALNSNPLLLLHSLDTTPPIREIHTQQKLQSTTTYQQRIQHVLSQISSSHANATKHSANVADLVYNAYGDAISLFIQDYARFIQEFDTEKQQNSHMSQTCDRSAEQCRFVRRRFTSTTSSRRTEERRERIVQRLLDNVHVSKYHILELRSRDVANKPMREAINARLIKHGQKADDIDAGLVLTQIPFVNHNKFIVQIAKDEQKTCTYHPYSSGVRFYYHAYYRHNQKRQELLPGPRPYPEHGNTDINQNYRFCDWYIAPKYQSIKEEIANVSMDAYENELEAATLKWTAMAKWIKTANEEWCIVYGIKRNESIQLKHILALLLYSNCDYLQRRFTKTFRRKSDTETDEQLKQRHSAFVHWAKALRECVEVFGRYPSETPYIRCFYHGVSRTMLFDNFNPYFRSPTSTTTAMGVAKRFATDNGDGIVITIKNNAQRLNYFFSCECWSDYPWEQEKLFIGGAQPLQICGLMTMSNGQEFDEWIRAMQIFTDGMMTGRISSEQVRQRDAELIGTLIASEMVESDEKKQKKRAPAIPVDVQELFKHMVSKRTDIYIDAGYFSEDCVCTSRAGLKHFGYLLLRRFYFTENNEIKWNVLRTLYRCLQNIAIQHMQPLKRGWRYSPSIRLDDTSMSNIRSFLASTGTQIHHIRIFYPRNSLDELYQISIKYERGFQSISYSLRIMTNYINPSCNGACTVFDIRLSTETNMYTLSKSDACLRTYRLRLFMLFVFLIFCQYMRHCGEDLLVEISKSQQYAKECGNKELIRPQVNVEHDFDSFPEDDDDIDDEPGVAYNVGGDAVSVTHEEDESVWSDHDEEEKQAEYVTAIGSDADDVELIATDDEEEQATALHAENIRYHCEELLAEIANTATQYAKQCPGGQNQSGSAGQDHAASHSNQQQSANNPLGAGNPAQSGGSGQNNNNDHNNNNGNNNGNPPFVFTHIPCINCMRKDQVIRDQAAQLRRCEDLIKVLLNLNQIFISNANTASLQAPPISVANNKPPPLTAPKKQKKKPTPKRRRKSNVNDHDTQSHNDYHPPPAFRAQGNIQIDRDFTEENGIMHQRIKEEFSDLYQYIDQAVALSTNAEPFDEDAKYELDDDDDGEEPVVRVINLDLHDQDTNDNLFCVIRPYTNKSYHWRMIPAVFTIEQLRRKYGISPRRLPQLVTVPYDIIARHQQIVHERVHITLRRTRWSKIRVYAPYRDANNKERVTLSLNTPQFMQRYFDRIIERKINKNLRSDLIPIMMFNAKNYDQKRYCIEYVQIIHIYDGVDIGISFKYDEPNDSIFVSGIHVEKKWILQQHELLYRGRTPFARYLDSFRSYINDLRIGNLDADSNRIKDLRTRLRMQSSAANMALTAPALAQSHDAQPPPICTLPLSSSFAS